MSWDPLSCGKKNKREKMHAFWPNPRHKSSSRNPKNKELTATDWKLNGRSNNLNAPLERKIKRKKKKNCDEKENMGWEGKWMLIRRSWTLLLAVETQQKHIWSTPLLLPSIWRVNVGPTVEAGGATSYRLVSASVNQSRWLGGLWWMTRSLRWESPI